MKEITPSDLQWRAIQAIVAWYLGGASTKQVFYLAGFAGTGKSTVLRFVLDELRKHGCLRVAIGTLTGKAAHVLRMKGNPGARTMHSGMYVPIHDDETGKTRWSWAEEAPFGDSDLIVIDEGSMINRPHAQDAERFGKKILVLADPGQLQPISGPAYWTAGEPDFFLDEVHRQALDHPILRLATMAREGKTLELGRWEAPDNDDGTPGGWAQVLPHNGDNQHWIYREETRPICGIHRVRWGYTRRMRRMRGVGEEPVPQPGEPIMCIRNDRELGIFNGMGGRLGGVEGRRAGDDANALRLLVEMDDLPAALRLQVHNYGFRQHYENGLLRPDPFPRGLHEFDFNYITTLHKEQGSEHDEVTIVDDAAIFKQDQHRWRYTACTRPIYNLTFLRRV